MDEIAATFEAAGLPGGFHQAAGAVFEQLAGFKDASGAVSAADLTRALLSHEATTPSAA